MLHNRLCITLGAQGTLNINDHKAVVLFILYHMMINDEYDMMN